MARLKETLCVLVSEPWSSSNHWISATCLGVCTVWERRICLYLKGKKKYPNLLHITSCSVSPCIEYYNCISVLLRARSLAFPVIIFFSRCFYLGCLGHTWLCCLYSWFFAPLPVVLSSHVWCWGSSWGQLRAHNPSGPTVVIFLGVPEPAVLCFPELDRWRVWERNAGPLWARYCSRLASPSFFHLGGIIL